MTLVRELWQFDLLYGIALGVGTGAVSQVIGTTVAHRWFRTHRGLVIGLFGAATSAGQLVFIPAMAALTVTTGWRSAVLLIAGAGAVALVPQLLFRPEGGPYGRTGRRSRLPHDPRPRAGAREGTPVAARRPRVWLLLPGCKRAFEKDPQRDLR